MPSLMIIPGDFIDSIGTRDPQPQIQQLLLLDLPAEVLDHIMHLSSLEDLRTWSSMCKLLRDHALKYVYEVSLHPHVVCPCIAQSAP